MVYGPMGFLSQIRGISFPPRPIDVLIVQVGVLRDWINNLDNAVLPGVNQIPASTVASPSFGSVTSGWTITANVLQAAAANQSKTVTDQAGTAITLGYAPLPTVGNGGAFGNKFINNVLVWQIPTAVQLAYDQSATISSPAYYYQVRGYFFVNLTLFKRFFPGKTISLAITLNGSSYSDYIVWAEVITAMHGATFNGSLKGFGGVGYFDSKAMGFPYKQQTNWLQALGTPTKTLSFAVMAPKFSLVCDPTTTNPLYKLSCTGSNFLANNVFSVKQGNGTTGEP
jgi:hypothetical protein